MRIDWLRLQCFRKFRDFRMVLADPAGNPASHVVIIGPNGSGKTSILEAMLLALGREDLMLRDLPDEDRRRYPRSLVTNGEVIEVGVRLDADAPTIVRTSHEHAARRRTSDTQVERIEDANLRTLLGAVEVEYFSSRRTPRHIGPIQADAQGRVPEDTEENRLWRIKNLVLQQQNRRGSPRYTGPSPLDRKWIEELNRFWRLFRNDGTTLDLDVVDPEDRQMTEWEFFLFKDERRICSISSLSSGELEALALAAPFVVRDDPFRGILLWDEPELHLHPEWQLRVFSTMCAFLPEAQIIAATHSPLVMAGLRPDKDLAAEDDTTVIIDFLSGT